MSRNACRLFVWAYCLACAYAVQAATIVTVDGSGGSGLASSIAIGPNGMPHIMYRNGLNGNLQFAACTALDCSSVVLDVISGGDGDYSSLAFADDGNPIVAYYDTANDSLGLAQCLNANCSGAETLQQVDNPANDVGRHVSMAIKANGRPIIAYVDSTNDALMVAACQNVACSSATIHTIDDDPLDSRGSYASLALGTDGFPVIAYADISNRTLKVAKCTNANCSSALIINTVDAPVGGEVGWHAALAIGADGNPVISYYDIANDALKVAKCIDDACSAAATITTLDERAAGAGTYTDIAIRPNGLPVISYRRGLAGAGGGFALNVAECRSEDCAGVVDLLTVDFTPGTLNGADTDIAIGSDGAAVISYYDATAQTLKVAKCSVQTCEGAGDGIFIDSFDR